MRRIGKITELWRYPVKSMRGERLTEVMLESNGIAGDRRFALKSTAAPAGKPLLSGRERQAMLPLAAHLSPQPHIVLPSGKPLYLDAPDVTAHLAAAPGAHLEVLHRPDRPWVDVRPVSLLSAATTQGLSDELGRPLNPQRFRSNLILALEDDRPFAEDALVGSVLHFGGEAGPQLRISERIPRCRVVTVDPCDGSQDLELMRHLAHWHEGRVGIYAGVVRTGRLRIGDDILCGETA